MNTSTIENINPYLDQLNTLQTYAHNLSVGSVSSNDERENIRKVVWQFLISSDSGISYKDCLKYTAYLISRFNLTYENQSLAQIKNERISEVRIIIWLISQNLQESSVILTNEDITFCNSHPFWNSLFIEGLKCWPKTDSVSAEILFRFNPQGDDFQSHIFLAHTIRDRGDTIRSKEILKRGISMLDNKTVFRYEAIREIWDNELKEESESLTKNALRYSWDRREADEFINICKIAREQGLYNEAFLATLRFLGTRNGNLSEEQQISLDLILLDGFLKQGLPGFYAGVQLYRKYHSKILEKAEIPSFFPNLILAAQKLGCSEVMSDITARCKDKDLPESPEWWRLKAEIFEFSQNWEDAYSFWQKLNEQNPKSSEIFLRIIENRLLCYDENNAERYVKKLAEMNESSLRIQTLSYQVLASISSPNQVIEIIRRNKDILNRKNPLFERVLLAYSEALCSQYEWAELEKVNDLEGSMGFGWKRFFIDLAKIMNFIHTTEIRRPSDRKAGEAIALARDLISSPITRDQILILLNVDLLDKIKKGLFKSDRNFSPLIEELAEEMELRIALEAESVILKLEKKNVNTQDYRKRLREMSLGLGSRQLLEDLEREYRSMRVGE